MSGLEAERGAGARGEAAAAAAGRRWTLWLGAALALAALALLWRLASEPFDHGYLRYAGIAAEMLHAGDPIVPRIAGQPYFQKPPLSIWLVAVPMAWAGTSAGWVQHVPDLIAWLLALGFTWRFGRHLFGPGPWGLAAALMLATSAAFVFLTRDKRIDPLFTAWLAGCFYFLYRAWVDEGSSRQRLAHTLAAYLLLALATLTKGPLALLFFALVAGSFAVWTGRLRRWLDAPSRLGVALLLGLVGVWPLLVVRELGVGGALEALRAAPLTTRSAGPLYYVANLLPRFLPWGLFLPALGVWLAAGQPFRQREGVRFLLCWCAGILIPLEISPARHYRYVLPLFPALALLVVASCHPTWAPLSSARALRWLRGLQAGACGAVHGVLALVPLALALAPWLAPEWRAPAPLLLAAASVGAVGLLGLRSLLRRRAPEPALWLALLGSVLALGVFDAARALDFARAHARERNLEALTPLRAGEPALGFGLEERAWMTALLATGRPLAQETDPERLETWLRAQRERAFVLTDERSASRLASLPGLAGADQLEIELAYGRLVLLQIPAAPSAGGARGASDGR